VTVKSGDSTLNLGTTAKLSVTDDGSGGSSDADTDALVATYTLTNAASTTAGIFALLLDKVTLSVAAEQVTGTIEDTSISYSPSTGLETKGFSFTSLRANFKTGPPGGGQTVIDASGSGLLLVSGDGVAADISLSLTTGPSFPSQVFTLSPPVPRLLQSTAPRLTSRVSEVPSTSKLWQPMPL
jgi:hypothetical protein